MEQMMEEYDRKMEAFLAEFADYVGRDYLSSKGLAVDGSLRFDQINFDIVDEVVTEHLVGRHFGMTDFVVDDWPDDMDGFIQIIRTEMSDRDQKKKARRRIGDSAIAID
jgi:hypothetical protein